LWQAKRHERQNHTPQFHDEARRAAAVRRLHGHEVTHVSPERVTAELLVTENLTNRNGVLHGGALMAFADNLGGTAATANLPAAGGSTATIESKTNFFAGIPAGDVAKAECTPLHRGRTTTVWQTRIIRGDGKLAAIVTQTQLMMSKPGKE
jgi:1,4-dihydroxy-2-naphthoyl-CoA hydrolase